MNSFPVIFVLLGLSGPTWATSPTRSANVFEVTEGPMEREVILAGPVVPKTSEKVTVKWFAMVKKLNVQIGSQVKKGDPIAEVDVSYLKYQKEYLTAYMQQLMNRFEQAKVNEKYLANRLERMRSLASQGIVGSNERDNVEVEKLQSRLATIAAETAIQNSKKQLDEVETQIKAATYFSPIDGVVTKLLVNPNQVTGSFLAMSGDALAQVDQPLNYYVRATTYDVVRAKLRPGMEVSIRIPVVNQSVKGTIESIQNVEKKVGEKKLSLYEVLVSFEQPGDLLPYGVITEIRASAEKTENALQVPWNAISLDLNGAHTVQVEESSGHWLPRQVTLGFRSSNRVEVKNGLALGERVRLVPY